MAKQRAKWREWVIAHPRLVVTIALLSLAAIVLGVWAYAGWLSYQWQNDDMLRSIETTDAVREDLRAQQDMAEFGYGLLLYGAFGFLATAAGVLFVAYTITQNRLMIEATREIGQNQTRAYVSPSPDGGIEDGSGIYFVHLALENFGVTPATEITVTARLTAASHSTERLAPLKLMEGRIPLVTKERKIRLFIEKDDLSNWFEGVRKASATAEVGLVRLAGEVQYTDVFGKRFVTGYFALIPVATWQEAYTKIVVHPGVFGAFKSAP